MKQYYLPLGALITTYMLHIFYLLMGFLANLVSPHWNVCPTV